MATGSSVNNNNLVMEEREELMVWVTGDEPTMRLARFLRPCVSSVDGQASDPSLDILKFSSFNVNHTKLPLKVNFTGWKNAQEDWKIWVDRMRRLHEPTWKKVGIFDAILSSTCKIHRNEELIFVFAERWCADTKSFVFPWGEATVTLEDMIVLGGFPVLGESVLCSSENGEMKDAEEKLASARNLISRTNAKRANLSAWKANFMNTSTGLEHEAFLAYWLSRFVFPIFANNSIGSTVLPLAVHLARGHKIALAPAVLSFIYHDLSLLRDGLTEARNLANNNPRFRDNEITLSLSVSAPLQLVQAWIWERFPTLQPKPIPVAPGEPRLAQWDGLKTGKVDVSSFLHYNGDQFEWRPYLIDLFNNGQCWKDYKEWIVAASSLDQKLQAFIRCVRPSELVSLNSGPGMSPYIEQYLPHRVAMQFGIDQDIPGLVERANGSHEIAWRNYNRPVGDVKMYTPDRIFDSDVTARYFDWWRRLRSRVNG